MEVSGQSLGIDNQHIISLNGKCYVDIATNSIHVVEGGLVMAKVSENPFIEKEARLMYDGMSNVLSSSHLFENVSLYEIESGVCGYTFTLPLNPEEQTTLSWTMNDDWFKGLLYFTF